MILNGNILAKKIQQSICKRVQTLSSKPCLAVIIAGNDPASNIYVANKEKAANEAGITSQIHRLGENVNEELLALIDQLNIDNKVHGILVQLPLPKRIDSMRVIERIAPEKDVDGFHPINVGFLNIGIPHMVPCTPLGIMCLLAEYNIPLEGKNAVIVGRSNIVGKPLASLFLKENCTVSIAHSKTKNLKKVCREADILAVALGNAGYITKEFVKKGAVVIDVGINRINGKVCGDVDFEEVAPIAGAITPVPKGVGPMTIAMLLENTLSAYTNIGKDNSQIVL